jgi:hypothetical protein
MTDSAEPTYVPKKEETKKSSSNEEDYFEQEWSYHQSAEDLSQEVDESYSEEELASKKRKRRPLQQISESQAAAGGRRKRKSERDLSYLRKELKKEFLWSREKIIKISDKLNLAETQVYKWWWDQTRKRQKRHINESATAMSSAAFDAEDKENAGGLVLFPSTDEFGGYSSRLRLQSCCSQSNNKSS